MAPLCGEEQGLATERSSSPGAGCSSASRLGQDLAELEGPNGTVQVEEHEQVAEAVGIVSFCGLADFVVGAEHVKRSYARWRPGQCNVARRRRSTAIAVNRTREQGRGASPGQRTPVCGRSDARTAAQWFVARPGSWAKRGPTGIGPWALSSEFGLGISGWSRRSLQEQLIGPIPALLASRG